MRIARSVASPDPISLADCVLRRYPLGSLALGRFNLRATRSLRSNISRPAGPGPFRMIIHGWHERGSHPSHRHPPRGSPPQRPPWIGQPPRRPLEHVELSTHAPRNCRRLQNLDGVTKVLIIYLNLKSMYALHLLPRRWQRLLHGGEGRGAGKTKQPFSRAAKR